MDNLQKMRDNAAWQPIETAPADCDMLLAGTMDNADDWRIKVGHRNAEHGGFNIYGASWEPQAWMPLPNPPAAALPNYQEDCAEFGISQEGIEKVKTDSALPCPFCGSSDIEPHAYDDQLGPSGYVQCNNCATTGPDANFADSAAAIEAWNRRSDAEIEQLRLAEDGAKEAFGHVVRQKRDLEAECVRLRGLLDGAHEIIRRQAPNAE